MPCPPAHDTPGASAANRIVRIQHSHVNRTTLCKISEKWKSLSAQKKKAPRTSGRLFLSSTAEPNPKAAIPLQGKNSLLFLLHRHLHVHDHFAVQLHRNLVIAHHLDRLSQHNLLPVNLKALAS